MNIVYVALGSNISPRKQTIFHALQELNRLYPEGFRFSSLYTTDPYQGMEQEQFINCCACFFSPDLPEDVLKHIWSIETKLGRIRGKERWMERTIDIDILLWNSDMIATDDLIVPHYDLVNRDFFMIPLIELDETLTNPASNLSLSAELASLPDHLKTNPQRIKSENQMQWSLT